MRRLALAWVADASGAVSGTLTDYVSGELLRVVFIPGSPAPTAAYDVTVLDENARDVLGGTGANLSATVTSEAAATTPMPLDDKLELRVANAGSGGAGTVVLYIR